DKRALEHIGFFLNSDDEEIKTLAREAFDTIEPNWREMLKQVKKEKWMQEIFKVEI
ncbi:hypothetical protein LCGC14_0786980, partial [marine sediment metagenome]